MAVVLVDGHRDAGDAVVEQRVDDAPGEAVDVGIHRRAHRNAKVAQKMQRLEHIDDHGVVHQGRHMPAHAGDVELAALDGGEEAVAVGIAGVLPPVDGDAGDLAGPAELGVLRIVGGALRDIERLVDEAPVQLHHHRLRMGVADVGVAVMDEEDFLDHGALIVLLGTLAAGVVRWLEKRRT